MNVKICGITTKKDAKMVLEAGADVIGTIVDVPVDTPRKISVKKAKAIHESLKEYSHAFVTVVLSEDLDEIINIYETVMPDGIQLHGNESPAFVREVSETLPCYIIKTVHIDENTNMDYVKAVAEYCDILCCDTKVGTKIGGTGVMHNLSMDVLIKHETQRRIMLAGGLNPLNVKEAVEFVKPYAVDVSTGVEKSPGVKDKKLVEDFIGVTSCL